jgi:hypothetical protein
LQQHASLSRTLADQGQRSSGPLQRSNDAAGKGPKDGGARLVQVARQAGIGFQLVRVWEGTRGLERSLKRRGAAARRCPVCRLQALGLTLPRRPTHPLDQLELGPAAAWLVTGRLVEAGQLELAA